MARDPRQLESVSLSRRALGTAFSWSLFNWVADVACLAFAAHTSSVAASLDLLWVVPSVRMLPIVGCGVQRFGVRDFCI